MTSCPLKLYYITDSITDNFIVRNTNTDDSSSEYMVTVLICRNINDYNINYCIVFPVLL